MTSRGKFLGATGGTGKILGGNGHPLAPPSSAPDQYLLTKCVNMCSIHFHHVHILLLVCLSLPESHNCTFWSFWRPLCFSALGSRVVRLMVAPALGVGSHNFRTGNVTCNNSVAPSKSRIYLHQQRQLPWSYLSGRTQHARILLELIRKVATEFACNGTSIGLHRERYC